LCWVDPMGRPPLQLDEIRVEATVKQVTGKGAPHWGRPTEARQVDSSLAVAHFCTLYSFTLEETVEQMRDRASHWVAATEARHVVQDWLALVYGATGWVTRF
jgi:hypothetical protein